MEDKGAKRLNGQKVEVLEVSEGASIVGGGGGARKTTFL